MLSLHEVIHAVLVHRLTEGAVALDATVGNGHDTAFLARAVGTGGHVWGCDVQEVAIRRARVHLEAEGLIERVTLVHAGHEQMDTWLPLSARGNLAVVMFNLGYLPGGDKRIITRAETTLVALEKALAYLRPGGLLSVVLYPGHPGGEEEAECVRQWARRHAPDVASVMQWRKINARRPAPEWLLIEKRQGSG